METSPLLDLPPELRTMIYEFTLLEEKNIEIGNAASHPPVQQTWRAPSLLQTCRQVRNEASAIYYSRNIFNMLAD